MTEKLEDKVDEPDFEDENITVRIKPFSKMPPQKADDGNIYGNLYQVTEYDKKLEIETLSIFSKDYNKPIHVHVQQKENRDKEKR